MTHTTRGDVSPPAVTVLVTSHNAAGFIRDGLESVIGQTYRDFEVLVVDDASSDGTVAIAESVLAGSDVSWRVERSPPNSGGPAGPRNRGIRLARGGWVALLDCDDAWHPEKLEAQMRVALAQDVAFVSSEKRWFREGSEIRRCQQRLDPSRMPFRRVTHAQLTRKNFLCTSSVLARREILARHPFPEEAPFRAVEDYWCWLQIHRDSVAFHPQMLEPLVFYRVSGSSISASKASMIAKHWMLYRRYFSGCRFPMGQVAISMATYVFASLYRQVMYRRTSC